MGMVMVVLKKISLEEQTDLIRTITEGCIEALEIILYYLP